MHVTVVRMETNETDNYKQVAFADRDGEPTAYVIMQRAIEPDAQDSDLALDGCYIETSVPSLRGYELCDRVVADGKSVLIQFKSAHGARPDDLCLDLKGAAYSGIELRAHLAFIARGIFADNGDMA